MDGQITPLASLAERQLLLATSSQIATGSKKKNFLIKSGHLQHLFGLFSTNVLCGDDPILEGKGKPDPTIFIEAAKMLGIQCVTSLSCTALCGYRIP